MSLDAIIKPADDALYESKRAGRNRATFAKRVKAAPSASAA
jgi:PleD family two-component response regulator